MIQATRSGARVSFPRGALRRLRREFETRDFLILPRFLEPGLLERIQARLDGARFRLIETTGYGRREEPLDRAPAALLTFHLNDPALIEAFRLITGDPSIRSGNGAIRRQAPGPGHYLRWHDDVKDGSVRAVLSVTLGRKLFQGGLFQIKRRGRKRTLSAANGRAGDALLARVSRELRHRNTAVVGTHAKVTYTAALFDRPAALRGYGAAREPR